MICVNISQPLGLQNLGPEIHRATFNTNQFQMILPWFCWFSGVLCVDAKGWKTWGQSCPSETGSVADWVRSTDKALLYGNMIHWIWYKYATYSINLWYVYFIWMNGKSHMRWGRPILWSFISGIYTKLALSQDFPAWGNIPMNYLTLRCTDILNWEDKSTCMHIVSRYMYIHCGHIPMQRYPRSWVWPSSRTGLLFWICWTALQQRGMINHKRAPDIDMFACILDWTHLSAFAWFRRKPI